MATANYRAYADFSAQSRSVRALLLLYAQIEREPRDVTPLIPTVVFAAFSVEAYLNSLGSQFIKFWDQIERVSWRRKVEILHKAAERDAKWGQEPLQFAVEVFSLRDRLAHGRPERVVGPWCTTGEEAQTYFGSGELDPDWYKDITPEWCLQSKPRFVALMNYLGELYGLVEGDHLLHASGGVERDD